MAPKHTLEKSLLNADKTEYPHGAQQWATFARMWYLLDGKMQPPGKLAAIASKKLQGLHKPVYHQLSDCGDHVVIINTRHIAFSGNKWEQKVYSSHTGYPDEDIPEDILKNLVEELPQPRKVPKRLDEYTQEEIEAFPRVWAPPEDYRL
ncbi:39S ribosomal protein L13, mitochondrial-like [Onychomys torridus]|uniref:39S ribosomal protein L13, mitochondrial-like n=1 Tax=Onychomys torridus TaxID=38674 RepID=UPI00167F9951|nr:39S ribosomal protein L13, mitochondrial-like [Onychomys torridus]